MASLLIDPLEFYLALRDCPDQYLSKHIRKALDTLSDALRLYGPQRIFSSYNAGKDADVIMHLLRAVFAKYAQEKGLDSRAVRPGLVFFSSEDEFDEVVEHIHRTTQMFNLDVVSYDCDFVEGLRRHLHSDVDSGMHSAFVLGTRRSDPNCGEQQIFTPSSAWMPVPFMRVNPILDWEYGHVWHFLRTFNLPYCSLYDNGYTSLGRMSLTRPNPSLRRKMPVLLPPPHSLPPPSATSTTPTMTSKYWPAYMLSDWSLERAGRLVPTDSRRRRPSIADSCYSDEASAAAQDGAHIERMRSWSKEDEASASSSSPAKVQSAAMIIIGDEILNGFTADSNLHVASTELAGIGIPLKRVGVISDDVEVIAAEVLRMSQTFDIVITSGGIGPTHDDVTLKAIAQALRQEIRMNPEMMAHLEAVQQELDAHEKAQLSPHQCLQRDAAAASASPPLTSSSSSSGTSFIVSAVMDDAMRRLAMLPEQSHLRFPPPPDDSFTSKAQGQSPSAMRSWMWPILQCENIFVLPGVPQFFAAKMQQICKHFLQHNQRKQIRKVVLDVEERNLVTHLDQLVARFPLVKVGSYPFIDHPEFKTIITLEGDSSRLVDEAMAGLLDFLPVQAILRVEKGHEYIQHSNPA